VLAEEVCVMVNRPPTDKPPTACAFCGQPFKVYDNHVAAWRSTSGKLYCSEFCAADGEEARSQNRRRA
jgi:hypothetical protein